MVSITLSVPEDVRHKMDMFPEINWSGFVRKSIEAIKLQLGIDPNLKITPQIISESWLADPQKLPNNQGFIETIQNEWIPLYQRPEQFHP